MLSSPFFLKPLNLVIWQKATMCQIVNNVLSQFSQSFVCKNKIPFKPILYNIRNCFLKMTTIFPSLASPLLFTFIGLTLLDKMFYFCAGIVRWGKTGILFRFMLVVVVCFWAQVSDSQGKGKIIDKYCWSHFKRTSTKFFEASAWNVINIIHLVIHWVKYKNWIICKFCNYRKINLFYAIKLILISWKDYIVKISLLSYVFFTMIVFNCLILKV